MAFCDDLRSKLSKGPAWTAPPQIGAVLPSSQDCQRFLFATAKVKRLLLSRAPRTRSKRPPLPFSRPTKAGAPFEVKRPGRSQPAAASRQSTLGASKRHHTSAPAALLALIMYLLKPVLEACSILAMRIGQTIAKLLFSIPKPLAMLPLLPPVVLVSPRLRRNARDLRNW